MKWIKIEDQLPKEGQRVITYHDMTGIDIMKYHCLDGTKDEEFGKNMFHCCTGFLTDDVTNWMPLPDKPEIKE